MNPFSLSMLGGGLGSLFGGLSSRNPADSAMPYLQGIEGKMSPYYDPYIQAGRRSLGTLEGQYGNLINDPTAIMSAIGGKFQASPGYQYNVNEATRAANQSAAASGMAGSPQEQAELAQTVHGLANQDYQQFLNTGLGMYQTGLGGLSNINQMGYNASNELAQSIANSLMMQAKLAYSGQADQNQSMGGMLGGLGSLAGFGLGSLLTL